MEINPNTPNYSNYIKKLNKLFLDGKVLCEDFKMEIIGQTHYEYPIHMVSIGRGLKDIFVVGGTHSSEIITVDFCLYLIEKLLKEKKFPLDLYTIKIIPNLNPEGYDIVTSCFSNYTSLSDFNSDAYEYYRRYKLDNLFSKIHRNVYPNCDVPFNLEYTLDSVFNSDDWKRIEKMFAGDKQDFLSLISYFREIFCSLEKKNFNQLSLLCQQMSIKYNTNPYFYAIMQLLSSPEKLNDPNVLRLHQEMFKDRIPTGLYSVKLEQCIREVYVSILNHSIPSGSAITHDATGSWINLNGNCPISPGLHISEKKYGNSPKNNVLNYHVSPLGVSCVDSNIFYFSEENKALINQINKSSSNGRYVALVSYHSTGGLKYYLPSRIGLGDNYEKFYEYNGKLVDWYSTDSLDYNNVENVEFKCFNDYLRSCYPGVLTIELSKMGGNPLGPFGDSKNIERVMENNFDAFLNLVNNVTINLRPPVNHQVSSDFRCHICDLKNMDPEDIVNNMVFDSKYGLYVPKTRRFIKNN